MLFLILLFYRLFGFVVVLSCDFVRVLFVSFIVCLFFMLFIMSCLFVSVVLMLCLFV